MTRIHRHRWGRWGSVLMLLGVLLALTPPPAAKALLLPEFELLLTIDDEAPYYMRVISPSGAVIDSPTLETANLPVENSFYEETDCGDESGQVQRLWWEDIAGYHPKPGRYTIQLLEYAPHENCLGSRLFTFTAAIKGGEVFRHRQDEIRWDPIAWTPDAFPILFEFQVDYPYALPPVPEGLEPWQELLSFRPTIATQERLETIDVTPQHVEWASARVMNLDYHEIRFNQLPFNPDSPREARFSSGGAFLEYIRTHMNDFVGPAPGNEKRFHPFSEASEATWSTSQATGALKRIALIDHCPYVLECQWGDVVVSAHVLNQNNQSYWRFSTVRDRGSAGGSDGLHPVSGNREFGLSYNARQRYWIFYTRGADRFDLPVGSAEEAYQAGDALWREMMGNMERFLTASNVTVNVRPTIAERYDWYPLCTRYWQPTTYWDGDPMLRNLDFCAPTPR